ncbi:MAG TPA: hypothetical protein VNO81_04790 [Candidatus Nitrosotenuis sp.]|jgi:hypothetical protein|nr:hypothetical protein [Candidatus Nitrosotenuis sp.]
MDSIHYQAGYGFPLTSQAMQQMNLAYGNGLWPQVDTFTFGTPRGTLADSADFFEQMRRLKQEALRRAAQEAKRSNPVDPNRDQAREGRLDVRAHGFYKGDTWVPVRRITISETNNYADRRHRTRKTFYSTWRESEYNARLDRARLGEYYTIQVTWADGSTQTREVRMTRDGQNVDVWHY